MPSIQEAWKQQRFSIAQTVKLITAYLNPKRPPEQFPWNKEGLIATPCMIGDPGIGKTSIVKQVARRLRLEYRDSQVGARAFEDVLGIPSREEDPNHPGHHKMLAPPSFPAERPLHGKFVSGDNGDVRRWIPYNPAEHKEEHIVEFCGYGVYFHDEVGTADPDKQNQVRDMLENRRVGVLEMASGWFQVAATNPPTRGFVTVKRMDRAVEDRLVYIPVAPQFTEVMGHWEANNMMPDSLYKYLMYTEGTGFFGTAESPIGPRRWVLAGDIIENLEREGTTEDDIFDAIAVNINAHHAGEFKLFRQVGDDPEKFPLRPKDFLDPETSERSLRIMKKWKKENCAALAGASILALRSWATASINEDKLNLTKGNLDTMSKLMAHEIIPIEHAQSIMNVIAGSNYGPDLVECMFENGVTVALMEKLADAADIAIRRSK